MLVRENRDSALSAPLQACRHHRPALSATIPPRGIVALMTDHCGGGHGDHTDHVAQYRRLFWVMLVLAVPTVAASGMFAMILGYTIPDIPGIRWVPPLLGTVM